jgi:hypothetical protein
MQVDEAINFSSCILEKAGLRKSDKDADFPIHVCGDKDIGAGAFKISLDSEKRNIEIKGGDAEGARCGIYELLEKIGVRWFSPSEDVILPELPVILDKAEFSGEIVRPSFPYRGLHICGGEHHYDEKVARWMSFNKMNRKLTHLSEEEFVGIDLEKLGLKMDTTVHSYSLMVPDMFFEANPEWFALVGGKRIRQKDGGQLCLSNKGMRCKFTETIIEYHKKYPQIATIGICPNDGYGWCECEECKKLDTEEDRKNGGVNGRVAVFVSDICSNLTTKASDIMLGHYSYSNFADFVQLLPDSFPNLSILFTQFHCFRHQLNDTSCPTNNTLDERMRSILSKVNNVVIYDYISCSWGQMPAPIWRIIANDLKYWKEINVSGFMSEVSKHDDDSWSSFWPAFYTAGKMLWNADQNTDELIKDWCCHRYGRAAKTMRRYYNTLESGLKGMPACFRKLPNNFNEMFTNAIQQQCRQLLDTAEKQESEGKFARNIMTERNLFNYWSMNYTERVKYLPPSSIKSHPMSKYANASGLAQQKIILTKRTTQLPDPENDTHVMVFSSDTELGFHIEMLEMNMDKLKDAKADVFSGDNIEIFLNDGKKPEKCYHFLIGPSNHHIASECESSNWNWSWKHCAEIKTFQYDKRWEVFFRIPKALINADKTFRFSIIRNRYAGGSWEISGVPYGGAFFNIEQYLIAE